MTAEYQVIARRFRPQSFCEVMGQEAIVTTLKNAIKFKRLAQAYLFCGSRGTGKTTLARIFAKALNCQYLTAEFEPCNTCASCREITTGASLDVLEIDGASHRGIEDIRQINETVGYAAAAGNYKIYIIDEVHMLTKEAFNALLKTLEEPPSKVKFFFATTEPHKVLPTILSRCQRFNLSRISTDKIVAKLRLVAQTLNVQVAEDALYLLAQRAEGGLRDAESLFDQILAFEEGPITVESVTSILGLMPRDAYFELDQAGKDYQLAKAFEIAHSVFSQGKDLLHFVDGLIEHFRTILLIKISGKDSSYLSLSAAEKARYEQSAQLYTQEQCLNLIEYLIEAQGQIRFSPSSKVTLESLLLYVLRSHFQLPIEYLVRRLSELEKAIQQDEDKKELQPAPLPPPIAKPAQPIVSPAKPAPPSLKTPDPQSLISQSSISEDPTPTPADLGIKKKIANTFFETPAASLPPSPQPPQPPVKLSSEVQQEVKKKQSQYDTLLQFAAIELEGKIQKNNH
jgi:DNA polymerase III subunit gamma/tau